MPDSGLRLRRGGGLLPPHFAAEDLHEIVE
jgi:hypothetical protein